MGIWGICGNKTCEEDILKPLGLISYGGGSNPKNGNATYIVYSISKNCNFKCEIDCNKIHNINKIYRNYLRKNKLEKINENKFNN